MIFLLAFLQRGTKLLEREWTLSKKAGDRRGPRMLGSRGVALLRGRGGPLPPQAFFRPACHFVRQLLICSFPKRLILRPNILKLKENRFYSSHVRKHLQDCFLDCFCNKLDSTCSKQNWHQMLWYTTETIKPDMENTDSLNSAHKVLRLFFNNDWNKLHHFLQ